MNVLFNLSNVPDVESKAEDGLGRPSAKPKCAAGN